MITIGIAARVLLTIVLHGYAGTVWSDPANDQLSMDDSPHFDLIATSVSFEPGEVLVQLSFNPATASSEDLIMLSGAVDFDADYNVKTGEQSHIDQFAVQPPLNMGVDYYLNFTPTYDTVELVNSTGPMEFVVGIYPIEIKGSTVIVRLPWCSPGPCAGLPMKARFRVAALLGNGYGITERAPNGQQPYVATPAAADFDEDGQVDSHDFDHFQACVSGPYIRLSNTTCQNADFDKDGDVDQDDFGSFQLSMTGALH